MDYSSLVCKELTHWTRLHNSRLLGKHKQLVEARFVLLDNSNQRYKALLGIEHHFQRSSSQVYKKCIELQRLGEKSLQIFR
jgi:ribonuclease PH